MSSFSPRCSQTLRVLHCVRSFTCDRNPREDQRELSSCAAGKLKECRSTMHSATPPSQISPIFPALPTCSSPDSKKDFVKAVHSILREKQRRQLLKTESLPRSQQYVPFGGKRLCALKGARPAMSRAGDEQSSHVAHLHPVLKIFDVVELRSSRVGHSKLEAFRKSKEMYSCSET